MTVYQFYERAAPELPVIFIAKLLYIIALINNYYYLSYSFQVRDVRSLDEDSAPKYIWTSIEFFFTYTPFIIQGIPQKSNKGQKKKCKSIVYNITNMTHLK